MLERLENGWQLVRESWEVLKLDKELLVFPLISGIACLLVLATFAVPIWFTGVGDALLEQGLAEEGGAGAAEAQPFPAAVAYVVMFAYYFANYFVIVFFNTALIACAIIRFKGGDPTLADGFSAAMSRLPQIAGWALVAATVGMILKMIESRSERFGAIVASLLGMAWSAVTYFVVPVIVVERTGPIAAGKRSLEILKRTWGESLVANFGVGLVMLIPTVIAFIPLIGGIVALGSGMTVLGVAAISLGIILLLITSLVSSALHAIIVGALYLYAAEGTVPRQFNDRLFRKAFAQK